MNHVYDLWGVLYLFEENMAIIENICVGWIASLSYRKLISNKKNTSCCVDIIYLEYATLTSTIFNIKAISLWWSMCWSLCHNFSAKPPQYGNLYGPWSFRSLPESLPSPGPVTLNISSLTMQTWHKRQVVLLWNDDKIWQIKICVVMVCAKFCSNMIAMNQFKAKLWWYEF